MINIKKSVSYGRWADILYILPKADLLRLRASRSMSMQISATIVISIIRLARFVTRVANSEGADDCHLVFLPDFPDRLFAFHVQRLSQGYLNNWYQCLP